MANTYYDMTGVLVLGKVTPVIKALFGALDLDESQPGNGEVYIACIAESTSDSWDAVHENLVDLAKALGLKLEDAQGEAIDDIAGTLNVLALHFKAEQNPALLKVISEQDFEALVDVDALFNIAKAFDDGHGLKAIKEQTAWHCDKARLFGFGGSGTFTGTHVSVYGSSNHPTALGEAMEAALAKGDVDLAASALGSFVDRLTAGIRDASARTAVRTKLGGILTTV